MLSIQNLKPKIKITMDSVECPVIGCCCSVERQRGSFRPENNFKCADHKIYISPSTFEYECEEDNLLWQNETDLGLLKALKTVKRESRIARDNSEDALTWNVFRYLENINALTNLLSQITQVHYNHSELIYWSYSSKSKGACPELNKAREEFGEKLSRSSEPDLIAVTDKALFFIEAKLTATNKTTPSNPNNHKQYLMGGNEWHKQTFVSDFATVAIQAKKYELFRFWLLGTWLAKEMGLDFYLINLVRAQQERDIEVVFGSHIRAGRDREFKRLTWEEIYRYINKNVPDSEDKKKITAYFQDKTVGYRSGELQKAFFL